MPDVSLVMWRDIPAQVLVGRGRKAVKLQLSERFEQAIDRCAMQTGAKDSDSYLAEWRKSLLCSEDGDPDTIATATAARLEAEYDAERLKTLLANGGHETARN